MTAYATYITKDGDRWDLIAYDFYGDPLAYEAIIVANPHAPIAAVLEGGLTLSVPLIESDNTVADADLPPWKRA